MADYTYHIFSGAGNSGTDWTTLQGAWDDFKAGDRMGGGTATVPAASNLYFKIDGRISTSTQQLSGIACTNDTTSLIFIESYSNAWNASGSNAAGYSTSYDGLAVAGANVTNPGGQKNLTFRNLTFNGGSGGAAIVQATGFDNTHRVVMQNCIFKLDDPIRDNSICLTATYTDLKNCIAIVNGSGTSPTGFYIGDNNTVEQCTVVCTEGSAPSGSIGIYARSTSTIKNCYVGNFATDYSPETSFHASCVGNASSGTGTPENNTALESVAFSTTNFTTVTGNGDLKVKSGSVLKTTGATRLSTTTTDCFGTSRSDPTTVGANEAAVVVTDTLMGMQCL